MSTEPQRMNVPAEIAAPTPKRLPLGVVAFGLCFILMSPMLSVIGIKGVIVLFGSLALLFINGRLLMGPLQKVVYTLWLVYALMAIFMCLYWGTLMPALYAAVYLGAILLISNLSRAELETVVRYGTIAVAVMIVLGWIGLLYFLAGGGPLFSIQNADGRDNFFYLTTFTNVVEDIYIRPSAIYDEPGAFSFIICTLCALRELFNKNRGVTAVLLVGGLVTLSIAHLIYMVFHFTTQLLGVRNGKSLAALGAAVLALALVLLSGQVQSIVREVIVERAVKYQGGDLQNPREEALLNVVAAMDSERVLLGFGEACVGRSEDCANQIGDYGENPLTPLVYGGIVLSWPYYLVIIGFLIYGLRSSKRLYLVGFAAILMQRPYVLEFPYSATVFLVIVALAYANEEAGRARAPKSRNEIVTSHV